MIFHYMVSTILWLSKPLALLGKELTTEDVYVTESSLVSLVYPFNATNGRMTWRGPPYLYPYSVNTLVNSSIFKSNCLNLTGNFHEGEYTLVIRKFTLLHVGRYQCETTKNKVGFRHRFNLFLKAKPVLVENIIDIKDGFVIFQICFYANPKPFLLKWYNNDEPLNDLIVLNSTFREIDVEISISGRKVNVTGYLVFLQTKNECLSSSAVFKCHIENSLGFIDVVFNEHDTSEFKKDTYSMSTMEISTKEQDTTRSGKIGSLKIYLPIASCVVMVCLLLTAVIIVLKKKPTKMQKGKTNDTNLPENRESVVCDVALRDGSEHSVQSVHEYEDVESISSTDSDQSYINHVYANSNNDVEDGCHYINTVPPHMYEDLNPNSRSEINIYDRRVEYNC